MIRSIVLALTLLLIPNLSLAQSAYYRGAVLHFDGSPSTPRPQLLNDGVLEIENGKVKSLKPWNQNELKGKKVTHFKDGLILPGFIDSHIHFPQTDMIAAPGGDLFAWLTDYTFPFEKKFSNKAYAKNTAEFFVNELLRNGTTTAMVFATIYPEAVDAIFEAAEKKNMRLISGKTLGDRNLPPFLVETPEHAYQETEMLFKKWHQKEGTRLLYALTPRFVPTTTPEMFEKLKEFRIKYPDVYVHTHISETLHDVKWSKDLTGADTYLDTYQKYGLIGKRSLLAHGVHLTEQEMKVIGETETGVAFCPTSNFFLGSGLFRLHDAEKYSVRVGMGTDVGAGTSFSMLQTLNEAYKVQKLQNQKLDPYKALYLATLGSARALGIEDYVGNFEVGKEADFVVLDLKGRTPLMKRRLNAAKDLDEKLFVTMILGDDRAITSTYVAGSLKFQQ